MTGQAVAAAIELWVERSDRLARHGADYLLPDAYKKVALKRILVGKIKETFELWEAEKLPSSELLRKTKELARARKLDSDVARGRSGVSVGKTQEEQAGGEGEKPANGEGVNAVSTGKRKKESKGKGKGTAAGGSSES